MKNIIKTTYALGLMAATSNAATISNISFSVASGGEAAGLSDDPLSSLIDGEVGNGDGSVLVSPTSDETVGLGHQYTINFTEAATISSFELFSDYRILDAYVTSADIEFFDAANAGGTSLGVTTGLVFTAPSTPDPDPAFTNPSWINPTSNVSQSVSATGALSAVITIQEVNNLTSGGDGGYQLRELSFNGALVPEPSSTALLGMAGLALIARRRRL